MENNAKTLVDVKDLKVSFFTPAGEVKAVRGVSWNLKEGEALGIVGESGSGKSVSVYALMGILQNPGKVIGGSITFNGIDMLELKEKQWQKIRGKDIAMIFQDPMTSLNPVYTVGNQIAETVMAHTNTSQKKLIAVQYPACQKCIYPILIKGQNNIRLNSPVECGSAR